MANFGLSRLRLVAPVQSWPNAKARVMAAGADRVLDGAALYDSLPAAIADCTFVFAATARAHDQAKPVVGAAEAAALMAPRVAAGENVALVFGRERNGLENEEVALADRILTLPVNPAFASLNLAQAVVVVGYEWFKSAGGGKLPFHHAGEIRAGAEGAASRLLRFARARAGEGRVLSAARQARDHADQSAQHLHPHAADAAGHPDAPRRDHGDRRGPQGAGARRGARRRGGADAARAPCRARRRPRAVGARPGARPVPAPAPQSDRGRARPVAGAGQRPAFRRPRLQAADADRAAYLRFRLVPAACGHRPRAECGGGRRRRRARAKARLGRCARL